jgi:hypothetical protein
MRQFLQQFVLLLSVRRPNMYLAFVSCIKDLDDEDGDDCIPLRHPARVCGDSGKSCLVRREQKDSKEHPEACFAGL